MSKRIRDRGDGALYKRGDLWVGAVELPTTDGKRRRATVSSKRYDVAAQKLRKLNREIEDGTFAASGKTTVEQWCDRWLQSIVWPRVRPRTYRHYEQCVRLYIVPTVGRKRLSKLTQQHVREMHTTLQETSTRNAQKAHQALQKALKDAVRDGLIARNVAEMVDKPQHLTKSHGSLTGQQALHLINTAVDVGDPLASLWAVSFYTGARPGELLGLEWDRVDLDAGVIDLAWQLQYIQKVHGCSGNGGVSLAAKLGGLPNGQTRTDNGTVLHPCGYRRPGWCPQGRHKLRPGFEYRPLQGSLLLTRPKTQAGTRIVPLAGAALAMLRAHYTTTQDKPNPHGLVWHDADGNPIHGRDEHRAWGEACEASGLAKRAETYQADTSKHSRRGEWEVRPPAPYVSRHTAATLFQEAGVPEDVRMQIMGHSSIVAHRGYIHTGQGPKRDAVAALAAVYDAEVVDD